MVVANPGSAIHAFTAVRMKACNRSFAGSSVQIVHYNHRTSEQPAVKSGLLFALHVR